jgi:hypothetical protein
LSAALLWFACVAGTPLVASTEEPEGGYRYDFGDAQATPAKGYVRLGMDDVYPNDRGRGVMHSQGPHERGWRRRGRQKDPRLDTFIFDCGGLTFLQDLPDGAYLVSLASGDATYDGAASVRINGQRVVELTETLPGGFVVVTAHQVDVTESQLKIEIGGHGRLSYLEILPKCLAEELGLEGSADPAKTVTRVRGTSGRKAPAKPLPDVDHLLPAGEFSVDRDPFGPIVRINMNRIRRWEEVPGIKRRWALTGPDGEAECYHGVSTHLKDVDGDGRLDIFRVIATRPQGRLARLDDRGRIVWLSEKLAPGCGDESGVPVEDLDADGRLECVVSHWAATYCIDAETGSTKWKTDLETGGEPGPGSWDYPMVVGHFADPQRFAVVVRAGLNVHCFGPDGNCLWTYQLEGHTYGHELDRYDVDGDGYHEIFIGRNQNVTALSHDGKLLWEDNTQRNHTDFFVFGDVDADGRCEVIYDHDGCGGRGPLYVADALTGRRKRTVDYRSEGLGHAQAMTCADFRPDLPGLELACTDKLHFLILFDGQGKVLWKRDVPTSLLSRADWDGDGAADILNFTVAVNVDGALSVWNGKGERLYAISWLPSPVRSHATGCGPTLGFDGFVDLDGNCRADVPVAFGPWAFGAPQNLFLMEAPDSPENLTQ